MLKTLRILERLESLEKMKKADWEIYMKDRKTGQMGKVEMEGSSDEIREHGEFFERRWRGYV